MAAPGGAMDALYGILDDDDDDDNSIDNTQVAAPVAAAPAASPGVDALAGVLGGAPVAPVAPAHTPPQVQAQPQPQPQPQAQAQPQVQQVAGIQREAGPQAVRPPVAAVRPTEAVDQPKSANEKRHMDWIISQLMPHCDAEKQRKLQELHEEYIANKSSSNRQQMTGKLKTIAGVELMRKVFSQGSQPPPQQQMQQAPRPMVHQPVQQPQQPAAHGAWGAARPGMHPAYPQQARAPAAYGQQHAHAGHAHAHAHAHAAHAHQQARYMQQQQQQPKMQAQQMRTHAGVQRPAAGVQQPATAAAAHAATAAKTAGAAAGVGQKRPAAAGTGGAAQKKAKPEDGDVNDALAGTGISLEDEGAALLRVVERAGISHSDIAAREDFAVNIAPLKEKVRQVAFQHGLRNVHTDVCKMLAHAAETHIRNVLASAAHLGAVRVGDRTTERLVQDGLLEPCGASWERSLILIRKREEAKARERAAEEAAAVIKAGDTRSRLVDDETKARSREAKAEIAARAAAEQANKSMRDIMGTGKPKEDKADAKEKEGEKKAGGGLDLRSLAGLGKSKFGKSKLGAKGKKGAAGGKGKGAQADKGKGAAGTAAKSGDASAKSGDTGAKSAKSGDTTGAKSATGAGVASSGKGAETSKAPAAGGAGASGASGVADAAAKAAAGTAAGTAAVKDAKAAGKESVWATRRAQGPRGPETEFQRRLRRWEFLAQECTPEQIAAKHELTLRDIVHALERDQHYCRSTTLYKLLDTLNPPPTD